MVFLFFEKNIGGVFCIFFRMFLDEIKKSLKIENMEFASPVVTIFGKVGAAVEGHKGILYFSDEEIRFKVKSRILSVSGKNLSLVESGEREAVVSGTVEKVEYV